MQGNRISKHRIDYYQLDGRLNISATYDKDEKFKNFVYGMIPMKKLVDVQDIVDGILYLCSPQAKMITGTSLLIDGGWTAH